MFDDKITVIIGLVIVAIAVILIPIFTGVGGISKETAELLGNIVSGLLGLGTGMSIKR